MALARLDLRIGGRRKTLFDAAGKPARDSAGRVKTVPTKRTAVAAAAYRAAEYILDFSAGRAHDYARRGHVVYSEIMAPPAAPAWATDRQTLWNTVDAGEKRADAQLFREAILSIPRELSPEQRVALVRGFVATQFVAQGMVADVNLHNPPAADGGEQPHAHVMLTLREIGPDGFGQKNRDWNKPTRATEWRREWINAANLALERAGLPDRVAMPDKLRKTPPQPRLGAAAVKIERRGGLTRRGELYRAWARGVGIETAGKTLAAIRAEAAAESRRQAAHQQAVEVLAGPAPRRRGPTVLSEIERLAEAVARRPAASKPKNAPAKTGAEDPPGDTTAGRNPGADIDALAAEAARWKAADRRREAEDAEARRRRDRDDDHDL